MQEMTVELLIDYRKCKAGTTLQRDKNGYWWNNLSCFASNDDDIFTLESHGIVKIEHNITYLLTKY